MYICSVLPNALLYQHGVLLRQRGLDVTSLYGPMTDTLDIRPQSEMPMLWENINSAIL